MKLFSIKIKIFHLLFNYDKISVNYFHKKKKYTMNLKIFIKKNIFNFLLNNFTSQFESSSCERQEEKTNTNYLAMFNVLTHKKKGASNTAITVYTPNSPGNVYYFNK